MDNNGMINNIIGIVLAIVALSLAYVYISPTMRPQDAKTAPAVTTATNAKTASPDAHGMKQYADAQYGFTFWYPEKLKVAVDAKQDTKNFPGGTVVETLTIGEMGGTQVFVVQSPKGAITDEMNGHASPIAQTKYSLDSKSNRWMVEYPEGRTDEEPKGPTAADVSKTTIGGLPELQSGRRFDTTIIPLNPTTFIVVSDGGGSGFTKQLAHTVAPAGATVDPAALVTALQAESQASANQ